MMNGKYVTGKNSSTNRYSMLVSVNAVFDFGVDMADELMNSLDKSVTTDSSKRKHVFPYQTIISAKKLIFY